MPTYMIDKETGKAILKSEWQEKYGVPDIIRGANNGKSPMIAPQMEAYESPVTPGKWIDSRKARREDLAESGCVPYETGMVDETNRDLARSEEKLNRAMDKTVDAEIAAMPTRKREMLEQELKAGASADVIRQ